MESFKQLKQKIASHTTVMCKEPDGSIFKGKIIDTATTSSSLNTPTEKTIYVLQKIMFEDRRKPMLRFGYYITGTKGNVKGRWVWGQYAPIIAPKDLEKLLSRARKKKIINGQQEGRP